MKKYLIFVLLIYISASAQESHNPLNIEIIKTVKPSPTTINKIVEIDSAINEINKKNSILADKYLLTHNDFKKFKYDNSKIIKIVREVLANDKNLFVKQYAVFRLFNTLTLSLYYEDKALGKKCIKYLDPGNILFSLDHNAILVYTITKTNLAHFAYDRKNNLLHTETGQISNSDILKIKKLNDSIYTNTLEEFYNSNADRGVKAAAIIYILEAIRDKNIDNKYYKILKSDFSDLKEAKSALVKYDTNSKVKVGNEVPYFKEKLLGKDKYITSDKLRGKYYMICFWATWCGNCEIEIKDLQDAYEKYKNNNFTILYVSLDNNDEIVKKFIKGKIKMPWYFIRLNDGMKNKMWKEFGNDESDGPPKNYLVNPKGIILENDYSWSANIDNTISNYIK